MQLLEYLTDLSSASYNFMCPGQFCFYAWCLSLITVSFFILKSILIQMIKYMFTLNIINEYRDIATGKVIETFHTDSQKNGASTRELGTHSEYQGNDAHSECWAQLQLPHFKWHPDKIAYLQRWAHREAGIIQRSCYLKSNSKLITGKLAFTIVFRQRQMRNAVKGILCQEEGPFCILPTAFRVMTGPMADMTGMKGYRVHVQNFLIKSSDSSPAPSVFITSWTGMPSHYYKDQEIAALDLLSLSL